MKKRRSLSTPTSVKGVVAGFRQAKTDPLRPLSFYEDNRIDLMRARKVAKIDTNERRIFFSDGKTTKFDNLILATGAAPRRLDLKGPT
ncbi:FAD-dependent oxidoreductase [Frigidibacter mobilis]|uniref:FAD-dependent oxidoreductase n=1 Tax=Frigidibacter mobilis TaxID=1335048 RepID=UPI00202B98F0|nr:FAD-dependent oxidoreductase [Frigidibacter mobilis]